MSHDEEFDTTVLTDEYGDFKDTVVEQAVAFDPSLFQGESGEVVQQAQRPTWVSAGSQVQWTPAVASGGEAQRPTWTSGNTPASAPVGHDPAEDTWVLGSGVSGWSGTNVGSASAGAPASAPQAAQRAAFVRSEPAVQRPTSWQGALQASSAMMAAADAQPNRTSPKMIAAIAALGLVGVIAIVVIVALLLAPPKSQDPSPATAPATVGAVASTSPSGVAAEESEAAVQEEPEPEPERNTAAGNHSTGSPTVVPQGDGRSISEREFYDLLSDYYDQVGRYDSSVRSAAGDFNENFLKEDMSLRSSKASTVTTLKSRIKSSWQDLKDLEPPTMSRNTQAYRDLCELYECLWHRIDVIDQAWKISLQYEKPKDHESEIVAPLRAQQENGDDIFYTRFNELYPTVTLVKP